MSAEVLPFRIAIDESEISDLSDRLHRAQLTNLVGYGRIPQNRRSPVLLAAEELIRKGAAAGNFVWLDSQDIAGVHKNVLRSVGVWILGVQREANEVKRTLNHIPRPAPSATDRDSYAVPTVWASAKR